MAIGSGFSSSLLATTSATSVYLANGLTTIAHGTLCNTTGSAVTVSLSLTGPGGVVDGTHNILSNYSLAANDTLSLKDYLVGAVLGAGDQVWAAAGTANAVTVVISGWF